MRKHSIDRVAEELRAVDAHLFEPLVTHLIGGGGMGLQGLKPATKDLDIVLMDEEGLTSLAQALEAADYTASSPKGVYRKMDARRVYEKEGAPQWDLFVRVVCKKLVLSPGMQRRARPWDGGLQRLDVRLVAPEDIFVFKSVTEREADREDQDVLFTAGLDWSVILDEMRWQNHQTTRPWAREFLNALYTLEDRGNRIPILKDLERLDEESLAEWSAVQLLRRENMTLEEIVQATGAGDAGRLLVQEAVDRLVGRRVITHKDGRYALPPQ